MTEVLIKREEDRNTKGRLPCEDRSRDWSDAATNQVAGTWGYQELAETRKDSSLEPLAGMWSCQYLECKDLAFRTVRE